MKLKATIFCIALSLIATLPVGSRQGPEETVGGVAVDITDARIANAAISFSNGIHEFSTRTQYDGTYAIKLKPGTYTMSASRTGFCTFRRAAFVLQKHSSLRFNFQMWVCPTDMDFIQYAELDEVPRTHLKPLILFAKRDPQGDLQRFYGPTTDNDGTGHARKYPVVLTFNLLTVKADEIIHDPSNYHFTALGNVVWEDGIESGTGNRVEIMLDGFKPSPNR